MLTNTDYQGTFELMVGGATVAEIEFSCTLIVDVDRKFIVDAENIEFDGIDISLSGVKVAAKSGFELSLEQQVRSMITDSSEHGAICTNLDWQSIENGAIAYQQEINRG